MLVLKTIRTVILVTVMIFSMMNPYLTISTKLAEFIGISKEEYVDFKSDFVVNQLVPENSDYMDDECEVVARTVIKTILVQLMVGNQDKDAVVSALNSLSHSDKVHDEGAYKEQNKIEKAITNAFKDSSLIPDDAKSILYNLSNGIYDIHVYLEETKYENIYQFVATYYNSEGEILKNKTSVYYDSESGCIYGKDNKGIFGIGFDYNAKEYVIVTPTDPWQKAFGFNIGYDIIGNLVYMDSKTVRVKFKYDGVDRMVQLWMGNYTKGSNGAEIGLYYLEDGRKLHYSCVDKDGERPMSMTLYDNDREIFTVKSEKHWWLSGFKLEPSANKNDMTLKFSIDFQDEGYATAFSAAAEKKGIEIEQNGSIVNGIWS